MPPKKKKDVTKKDEEGEVQSKPAAQEPKKEVKDAPVEPKPAQVKKDVKKAQEPKPTETKVVKSETELNKKISLDQPQKLSEAEILERRKLRFNLVGTEMSSVQAQKISKERMEKFGSTMPESKEDLQKRKEKFASGSGSLNLDQDPTVIEKRKEKFSAGNQGALDVKEDPSLVEERKKKFGTNDVNLDAEISKEKERRHQNRGHRGGNFKRNRPQHNSVERYDNRGKRFKY